MKKWRAIDVLFLPKPKTIEEACLYSKYRYEALKNEMAELEKCFEKYKAQAKHLEKVEQIKRKKKERRKRNKAKGPRK